MNIRDKRITGLLTPGAVAKLLGVSRQRIDQLLIQKRIKYTWIGASRYIAKEDAVKPQPIPPGRPPKYRRTIMTYDDWKLQSPHETVEVYVDEAAAYFDCGLDEVTDSMLAKYAELRSDPDFWRENEP